MLHGFLSSFNQSPKVSPMSSIPTQTLEQTPAEKVVKFLDKKGKLELWAGTIAAKGLAFGQKQQELNQSAEDAYTRRQLWGEKPGQQSGDDMGGHTILGDIIVPSPSQPQQPQQSQSSGLGKVLAGAALGASLLGVPGAGIAGYLFSQIQSQKPAAVTTSPATQNEGETVDLGLKKIEDLEL
jgi:uncharacterized protein HemX